MLWLKIWVPLQNMSSYNTMCVCVRVCACCCWTDLPNSLISQIAKNLDNLLIDFAVFQRIQPQPLAKFWGAFVYTNSRVLFHDSIKMRGTYGNWLVCIACSRNNPPCSCPLSFHPFSDITDTQQTWPLNHWYHSYCRGLWQSCTSACAVGFPHGIGPLSSILLPSQSLGIPLSIEIVEENQLSMLSQFRKIASNFCMAPCHLPRLFQFLQSCGLSLSFHFPEFSHQPPHNIPYLVDQNRQKFDLMNKIHRKMSWGWAVPTSLASGCTTDQTSHDQILWDQPQFLDMQRLHFWCNLDLSSENRWGQFLLQWPTLPGTKGCSDLVD